MYTSYFGFSSATSLMVKIGLQFFDALIGRPKHVHCRFGFLDEIPFSINSSKTHLRKQILITDTYFDRKKLFGRISPDFKTKYYIRFFPYNFVILCI